MKRIISIALVCLMLISLLASCGKKYIWLNYDFEKYITLPDYNDAKVDVASDEFKEYLNGYVESILSNASLTETKEKDGAVADGDTVTIDFVGKINGEEFEGGTSKDYSLVIGSNTFIDGFEDGLVGAKKGEKRSLNLKFPEDYNEEFAGKDVVFEVTVNKISEVIFPEVNEDIAKKLGYENLADYNEKLEKTSTYYYVFEQILDKTKVSSYPDDLVDYLVDLYIDYCEQLATSNSMTLEDYIKQIGFKSEKEFRKELSEEDSILVMAKEYLIFYSICDSEGLYPESSEEYEKMVEKMAKESNTTVDALRNNSDEKLIEANIIMMLVEEYFGKTIQIEGK